MRHATHQTSFLKSPKGEKGACPMPLPRAPPPPPLSSRPGPCQPAPVQSRSSVRVLVPPCHRQNQHQALQRPEKQRTGIPHTEKISWSAPIASGPGPSCQSDAVLFIQLSHAKQMRKEEMVFGAEKQKKKTAKLTDNKALTGGTHTFRPFWTAKKKNLQCFCFLNLAFSTVC